MARSRLSLLLSHARSVLRAQSELLDKGLVKNFQYIPATGDSLDHITAEVQGVMTPRKQSLPDSLLAEYTHWQMQSIAW